MAYTLLRDQLNAGQRSAFADKMLNDEDDYGATCTKNMTLQSGSATTVTGSTAVTGTGTDFTTITPGSIVFMLYRTTSVWSLKTHWTTVSSVASATSMTIANSAPFSEGDIMLYVIRPWQTGDCGWRWYTRGHAFSPSTDRRRFTFTLSAPITESDTTMTVSAVPAKAYPYLIRADQTGQVEYMLVTGATGNTLNITRGQLNSTPASWPTGRIFYVGDPLENFGFGSTFFNPPPEAIPFDDPRHNLTLTKIFGNLMVGLALADDDERARLLLQSNFNYWYDAILPFNKRSWTGLTQAANEPGYNSRHHWNILFGLMFKNSFTPEVDITGGDWLKNTMVLIPGTQLPGWGTQVWPFSDTSAIDFAWRHTQYPLLAAGMYPTSDQAKKFMWWLKTKMGKFNTTEFGRSDSSTLLTHALFTPGPNETAIEEIDYTSGVPDFVFNTVDQNDAKATPISAWHSRSDWTDSATSLFAISTRIPVDHTGSYPGPGAYKIRKGSVFLSGDAGNRTSDTGTRANSNYLVVGTGTDFNGPGGPLIDKHKAVAGYSYIRVNNSTSYTTNRTVTRAHRHLLHVKGTADVMIAYDQVATSSAQVRKKQFHTYSEGNEAPTWSRTDCKAIHTRPTSNARLVVQMVGAGVTCSEVLPAMVSGRTYNKLVADFSSTTSSGLFTVSKAFLNTSGDVADIAAIGTISSSHEGVEIPSLATVAVMPKDGSTSSLSLTYATSAAAQHIVAGLSVGEYSVTVNGSALASNLMVGEDGVLAFQADAGGAIVVARSGTSLPLQIVTGSVPNPRVGVVYGVTLLAAGGTSPYSWVAQDVPAGLELSSTGVLSGIPTSSGVSMMTVTVTDALSASAGATITVAVDEAEPGDPGELTIETASLPTGTAGQTYSATLSATGGSPPYEWSIDSTSCVDLTISDSTISWPSAIAGECSVTVRVTDSDVRTSTRVYTLIVQDEPSLPNRPDVFVSVHGTLLRIRYGMANLLNSTPCLITTQDVSYEDSGGPSRREAYISVPVSTLQRLRVNCAGAYTEATVTTGVAYTGTAAVTVQIGPSAHPQAALDVSTDGSSWSPGESVSCTAGCTLIASGLNRGSAYWIRWRRGAPSGDKIVGPRRQVAVR